MKISKEPVSAFAIYSEKLKQKRKKKSIIAHKRTKSYKKIDHTVLKTVNLSHVSNFNDSNSIIKVKKQSKQFIDQNDLTKNGKHKLKNVAKTHAKLDVFNKEMRNKIARSRNNLSNKVNTNSRENVNSITSIDSIEPRIDNLFRNEIGHKKTQNSISQGTSRPTNVNKKRPRPKNNKLAKIDKNKSNTNLFKANLLLAHKKNENKHENNDNETNKVNVLDALDSECYTDINKLNNSSVSKQKKVNQRKSKIKSSRKKVNISHDIEWARQEHSLSAATRLFEWLILPLPEDDFMRIFWEKKPLLIQRDGNRNYFSELLCISTIDAMLRENNIFFTKHLDVTSYSDGVRETHNLSGRAHANVVWDFYSNGCSVRLLNPQSFIPKIHALNATLQEYFGCFVGANVYLTPPNSQGFAPHYDDIEAFVLQIEGKKHWKVYLPRNDKETLPRFSSPNFTQEDIGKPFLDVTLEPGDILYFPRGFIHQASTVEGEHSLHITLSAYQKTAWIDLLEKALPIALKRAAAEDLDFRKGLPKNYLEIEYQRSDSKKVAFMGTAQKLMSKLGHFLNLSLGAGVDQMGAQFMHDALPPVFTSEEKQNSVLCGGLKMTENGKIVNRVELDLDTRVKLVRNNVTRLVEEEDEVRLYHCLDNPLEYHAEEPQFLVLPQNGISLITFLAVKYPSFVKIESIPYDDTDELLALISDLWDAGLLVTQGIHPENNV